MNDTPFFKRPLVILSMTSFVATVSIAGYFYLQQQKPIVTDKDIAPIIKSPASVVVNSQTPPTTAQVLSDLFGVKTTTDKVANAADQISSLWFSQSFEHAKDKYHAVFIKSQIIDPDTKEVISSHASSANVGIVVYQFANQQWQLFSKQLNVGSFGSWGDVPETKNVPTLQLSTDTIAFLIEGGSSGQGYTEAGKGLFVFNAKTKAWHDGGFIQTGGDNAGACDDKAQGTDDVLSACWKFTGEISISKAGKNPDYPDLLVTHQGTISDDDNKIVPVKNHLYVFDGEQYVEEGAESR